MAAKKQANITQEEMIRRTRIMKALEKVSAELRPLLERSDIPSEKRDDIASFLGACDRTRIVFSARETCSDMPIDSFVQGKILKEHIKECGVRRLSQFMATPEAKFCTMCEEVECAPSELLIRLHRAYQHATTELSKQQAWFSPLVRD